MYTFKAGLLVVAMACFSGCAAIPQHQVSVGTIPTIPEAAKVSAYVDLRYYQGEPGDATADGTAYTVVEGVARQAFHESGIFSTVGFSDTDKLHAQKFIRLSVYEKTDHVLPVVTTVISYFTAFILPTYGSNHFVVDLEVIDPQTGTVISKSENRDAIHRYAGLLALPAAMAGDSVSKAFNETLGEQFKAALAEQNAQGQFRLQVGGHYVSTP